MSIEAGALYVVATPIGNLEDITQRALRVLRSVDVILAEDTRHSSRLLQHFGIDTPMMTLHEHNERRMIPRISARLARGESMALIADAGTPLISDPGYQLVRALRMEGIRIVPLPGPCALVCALSVSALPTDRFAFEGFLPAKQTARIRQLDRLSDETRTLVFFEAPHRIEATVRDMADVFGPQRQATIARELTKVFETVHSATLKELLSWLEQSPERRKGEFVVLVRGNDGSCLRVTSCDEERILKVLLDELPLRRAVSTAARLTGQKKNRLYARALALNKDGE